MLRTFLSPMSRQIGCRHISPLGLRGSLSKMVVRKPPASVPVQLLTMRRCESSTIASQNIIHRSHDSVGNLKPSPGQALGREGRPWWKHTSYRDEDTSMPFNMLAILFCVPSLFELAYKLWYLNTEDAQIVDWKDWIMFNIESYTVWNTWAARHFALSESAIKESRIWTAATSLVVGFQPIRLDSLLYLHLFVRPITLAMDWKSFSAVYIGGGAASMLASLGLWHWKEPSKEHFHMGASGAIATAMAYHAVKMPNHMWKLFFRVPIPYWTVALAVGLYDLQSDFVALKEGSFSNTVPTYVGYALGAVLAVQGRGGMIWKVLRRQ